MTLDNKPHFTGGCQCGAVRFHLEGQLGDASICHCRMCQKAFGNFYAPLVSVGTAKLTWQRNEPQRFQSSNHAKRGFCEKCGTPLTYEISDGIALAIGAFDDPAAIKPSIQWGIEKKLPYLDKLTLLPGFFTERDEQSREFVRTMVSYQYPDHEADDEPK